MAKRASLWLIVPVVVWGLTTPASAVDLGLGVRGGTYGVGADLGVGITNWFGVRVGGSFGDLTRDYEDSGIDFNGDLTLGGYGAFADFYPSKGGFRISAGYLANRNEIGLDAVATEDQEIGDGTYPPEQIGVLSGTIAFDDSAPYLGLGWGRFTRGEKTKRVGFLFDVGALMQGSGEVSLSSTGTVDQDDLDKEAAEIEDDIEAVSVWPVISLGLAIRF